MIRADIVYAIRANAYADTLWASEGGRATMPPSNIYSLPVELGEWNVYQ